VKRAGIKSDNSNEDSCERGILHNHLSHNNESISRDNTVFTYSNPSNQSAFVCKKFDFLRKINLKNFFFTGKINSPSQKTLTYIIVISTGKYNV